MFPFYDQKTDRMESHLLVCLLSLALWRSLEMWMQAKGLGPSARKLMEAMATIRSMDVLVPVRREDQVLTLRLRTVAKPNPDVALLPVHLGLRLPRGSTILQNVVEKKSPLCRGVFKSGIFGASKSGKGVRGYRGRLENKTTGIFCRSGRSLRIEMVPSTCSQSKALVPGHS